MLYKDCLTGISVLIERLNERASVQPRGIMSDVALIELLLEAANKIEEIADELIDSQNSAAIRIIKLEQELARIKGLTMEYS